jgi:uncharacterized Zn finger protein
MTKSPTASLSRLITPDHLRRLAGRTFFSRGEEYYSDGHVRLIRCDGEVIAATVMGTETYRVKLWAEDGELAASCSCPLGDEAQFCKHCVATGLAWIATRQDGDGGGAKSAVTMDDIRTYLAGLETRELVEMIVVQVRDDDALHQRLLLRLAKEKGGKPDLATWRRALDDAIESDGFTPYEETHGYAQGIDDVIDAVEELLKDGHADAVIELTEYAIKEIGDRLGEMDDSDGEVHGTLHRLRELHLAACEAVQPEPEALAQRLFDSEITDEWDTFSGAVALYADVLGERGLAAYRLLAEAEWAKVPALAPGETDADRYGKRFRITSIMETLAHRSGDIEAVVAVKSRDLSTPYAFLQIASLYKEAGDAERALAWAERGWAAFADPRSDDRLRQFLADAYHESGRHDDAMRLAWQAFSDHPGFEAYRALKREADRARAWKAWREKALARIHERIVAAARQRRERTMGMFSWQTEWSDHSVLVEIFLWERDLEGAWREAKTAGCSPRLWLMLAEKRAKAHPLEAVAIYQEHIARLLAGTNAQAYQEAIGYARKTRDLLTELGQTRVFAAYAQELRVAHRRKRNFIKLLDQAGW